MANNIYKPLYLFFIRKIANHFEECHDFEKEFINSFRGILQTVGQIPQEDQGSHFLFYPLITVRIEDLMDSICNVPDFYRELQVSLET